LAFFIFIISLFPILFVVSLVVFLCFPMIRGMRGVEGEGRGTCGWSILQRNEIFSGYNVTENIKVGITLGISDMAQ
jgi:hypothetical protein